MCTHDPRSDGIWRRRRQGKIKYKIFFPFSWSWEKMHITQGESASFLSFVLSTLLSFWIWKLYFACIQTHRVAIVPFFFLSFSVVINAHCCAERVERERAQVALISMRWTSSPGPLLLIPYASTVSSQQPKLLTRHKNTRNCSSLLGLFFFFLLFVCQLCWKRQNKWKIFL
jgi:hypothetical protein